MKLDVEGKKNNRTSAMTRKRQDCSQDGHLAWNCTKRVGHRVRSLEVSATIARNKAISPCITQIMHCFVNKDLVS